MNQNFSEIGLWPFLPKSAKISTDSKFLESFCLKRDTSRQSCFRHLHSNQLMMVIAKFGFFVQQQQQQQQRQQQQLRRATWRSSCHSQRLSPPLSKVPSIYTWKFSPGIFSLFITIRKIPWPTVDGELLFSSESFMFRFCFADWKLSNICWRKMPRTLTSVGLNGSEKSKNSNRSGF